MTKKGIISSAIVLLLSSPAIATAGVLQWRPPGPYPTHSTCQPVSFDQPDAIAVDGLGDIYIGNESGPNALQEITARGAIVTLLDRRVEPIKSGHYFGLSLAINGSGTVFLGVERRGTVERLNSNGTLTVIAGKPGKRALRDGPASTARLKSPTALAIGRDLMYVIDTRTIRRIGQDGSIKTLAGNPHAKDPHPMYGGGPYSADGNGVHAVFMSPNGIAVDGRGNIYVTDGYNGPIEGRGGALGLMREVSPLGHVTTVAGTLDTMSGDNDGYGANATFDYVYGIAVGSRGDIYVAEPIASSIRLVDPIDDDVSTVTKAAEYGGSYSITGLIAPTGIAVGPKGEIFIVDDPALVSQFTDHAYWLHRLVAAKLETLCQVSIPKK